MTIKRWLYIAGIVVSIVILAIGAWWIYRLYSRASQWEKMYYDCLAAPSDTVVIWKDRVIFSDDTIKPSPRRSWKRTDTIRNPDTTTTIKEFELNYYAETYQKSGVKIHWEAVTKGTLDLLRFPNIIIPERVTTVGKRVPVHDTITRNIELSHVGLYAKLFVNNFNDFPPIEMGGIMFFKGKGGMMAGFMYNPAENNLFVDPVTQVKKTPLYFTVGGFFIIK